jgi:hypothetical protein
LRTNQKTAFSFISGYAAMDDLLVDGNYTSAAVNLSLDIFGGRILKGITGPIFNAFEKYSFRTFELAAKYPNIAAKLKSLI